LLTVFINIAETHDGERALIIQNLFYLEIKLKIKTLYKSVYCDQINTKAAEISQRAFPSGRLRIGKLSRFG
jgi:hypothetical protein